MYTDLLYSTKADDGGHPNALYLRSTLVQEQAAQLLRYEYSAQGCNDLPKMLSDISE